MNISFTKDSMYGLVFDPLVFRPVSSCARTVTGWTALPEAVCMNGNPVWFRR